MLTFAFVSLIYLRSLSLWKNPTGLVRSIRIHPVCATNILLCWSGPSTPASTCGKAPSGIQKMLRKRNWISIWLEKHHPLQKAVGAKCRPITRLTRLRRSPTLLIRYQRALHQLPPIHNQRLHILYHHHHYPHHHFTIQQTAHQIAQTLIRVLIQRIIHPRLHQRQLGLLFP